MLETVARVDAVLDPQRITQAIVALADNACRYTRPGDRIAIGSQLAGGLLRFWVSDTGPGVTASDRARIFERFARGAAAGPRSDGAGLGLSIVRAIAVAHGGDGAAGQRARSGRHVHRRGATGPAPGGAMSRILIAEDEPRIAAFVEKGLSANGFAVTVVGDGPSAYDYAMTGGFDLMVLDIGLPGMDGFAVLRKLRAERCPMPVIVLTARDSVQDTVAGLEGGADDYMPKPFRFEELLARVRLRLATDRTAEPTVLAHGGLQLDLRTRRARVGGRTVDLSAREFAMTETFLRHPGQVLSREQLLSHVWGYDFDPGSNVVDVYVRYLRRKLGAERIVTVRGMGYRLDG